MDHPLIIIGPKNVKDKITNITDLVFSGLFEKLKDRLELKFVEITGAGEYNASGFEFSAVPMEHGNTEAYGYKFEVTGKSIGYTGDTGPCDGLTELASGLDILIIEMSNPYDDVPGHMSLEKLKTLRKVLRPGIKIILNHAGEIKEDFSKEKYLLYPNDFEVIRF